MIHRESPAMKELFPELGEVMRTAITSVNYMKTCPLKNRLFAELCKVMGAQYQSLLFYCNSRWLSRGNAVACVYNLQVAAALFSEEEKLHAEHFISKLAHLSDIFFEKFNTLNPSMQGNDTNIIIVTDKLKTFIGKLGLWVRKLETNSVETSDIGTDQCIKYRLVNLQ
jgi:hypothetical protein